MNKLNRALAAAGASAVLALGMAGAAAADAAGTNNCSSDTRGPGDVACTVLATDASKTIVVSGNCSGYFQLHTDQSNANGTAQIGESEATNTSRQNSPRGDETTASNSGNSTSSTSQSNTTDQSNVSSFVFSPDCSTSTTNVTQQAAAAAPAAQTAAAETESPQVVVPRGAVHAGGGAGVASSSAPAFVGLTGSVASLGLGLVMRKKALFDL